MFYKLKVHPDAKENRLIKKGPDSFELWVKAPAERGRANTAAIELLAAVIGTDPKRILLIKGARSPAKIVKVI
jgi:hypothetical protein